MNYCNENWHQHLKDIFMSMVPRCKFLCCPSLDQHNSTQPSFWWYPELACRIQLELQVNRSEKEKSNILQVCIGQIKFPHILKGFSRRKRRRKIKETWNPSELKPWSSSLPTLHSTWSSMVVSRPYCSIVGGARLSRLLCCGVLSIFST